jgi:hypothetical protein
MPFFVIESPLSLGGYCVGGEIPSRLHWRSKAAMASALVGYQCPGFTFVL